MKKIQKFKIYQGHFYILIAGMEGREVALQDFIKCIDPLIYIYINIYVKLID